MSTGGATAKLKRLAFPLLICLSAIIPYSASPTFQFVFDDKTQVLSNPTLLRLSSIPQYFEHHLWSYVPKAPAKYLRPVFATWLNLNYAIFGLHPAAWHVALIGLHVLVCYLVFQLVAKVFQDRTLGLVAALIFAVHPVHVESVAWVSGANDPLVAIFVIASFLIYRKAQDGNGWPKALLTATSLACFGLALLTKETVLLYPALILFDSFQAVRPRRIATALAWGLPYVAIALAYCLYRVEVLGRFGQTQPVSVSDFFLTLPSLLFFYLTLLLFPVGLSLFYDTPYINQPDFRQFWMPLLVLAAFATITWMWIRRLDSSGEARARKREGCVFFVLWTIVFLIPALDLKVLDAGEIAHDRYLYLPSVGFCALLAVLLRWLADRLALSRQVAIASVVGLVLLLGMATATQAYYWKNDFVLYRRAATVAPLNLNAQNNLADAYLESRAYDQGIALHKKILERDPLRAGSYHDIGLAYYFQNDFSNAESYLQRALSLRPLPEWYFNLGMAQLKNGKSGSAEKSFEEAVRLDPSSFESHVALAATYEQEGKLALSLKEYESAIQINPTNQAIQETAARMRQQLHP